MAKMPTVAVSAFDPLNADLLALDAARNGVDRVLRGFPSLKSKYRKLCNALPEERKRGVLPPVERLVENRIVGMLSAGAGAVAEHPPAIFPRSAPLGYQRMLVVPLWPACEPRQEVRSGDADEGSEAGAANAQEGSGRFLGDVYLAVPFRLLVPVAGVTDHLTLQCWKPWRYPALAFLHLAWLWLPLGLVLTGTSLSTSIYPDAAGALHSLTMGAMGTMMFAIMGSGGRLLMSHEFAFGFGCVGHALDCGLGILCLEFPPTGSRRSPAAGLERTHRGASAVRR